MFVKDKEPAEACSLQHIAYSLNLKMPKHDISIIGGGPAGMMAAITAARSGNKVRLWERNHSPGRKLLATGNGRCNLSNEDLSPIHFHGEIADAVSPALEDFGLEQTLSFFSELGLECYCDEKGRYFPSSNEASSVLYVLEQEMERLGVEACPHSEIMGVKKSKAGFVIHQRGQFHKADKVIIACGGKSAPQFGSDGGGSRLAKELGHHIISLYPALVPLELEGNWFHKLQGVRMDLELTIPLKGQDARRPADEGLFTKYGISGPLALGHSRLLGNGDVRASLNFFPGKNEDDLKSVLHQRARLLESRPVFEFFTGLLPRKVGQMLVRESRIASGHYCRLLAPPDIEKLARSACSWPIKIKGTRPFKEAQVTAGGVDMREVFPKTMESRLVPGLYFAGEVLDVDGDSGGYNLQWAWSSGYLAGLTAGGN
jgi:hypothetical protein